MKHSVTLEESASYIYHLAIIINILQMNVLQLTCQQAHGFLWDSLRLFLHSVLLLQCNSAVPDSVNTVRSLGATVA